jgi:hypothetical protein
MCKKKQEIEGRGMIGEQDKQRVCAREVVTVRKGEIQTEGERGESTERENKR